MNKFLSLEVVKNGEYLSSSLLFEDNKNFIRLTFKLDELNLSVEDEYPFFALVKLRSELEKTGLILLCQGARKDIYPSGASSIGLMAYEMKIGQPAKKLVNIFESTKDINSIGTVMEQKAYREDWLQSLA